MNKKVSVLIPAYNVEKYLNSCVESVLAQTYQNFEILIVNDGSADNTFECMESLAAADDRIKIFDSENKGQGYQRNRMLEKACGDCILFLDSDDYLEPYTLELALRRINEDDSDLVYFDWKYVLSETGQINYKNKELFFGKETLEEDECLLLLSISPYFSVNRLYSKDFLVKNNIKYGEGYLYEDNPFIVATAFYAKKISIIHSPLYYVRVSDTSSTKTNTNTDVHYQGFIKSIEICKEILKQKPDPRHYYYYRYAMTRYFLYIRSRIPKRMRKAFGKDFLEVLSDVDIVPLSKKDNTMRLFVKHDVFKKKKYFYLKALTCYSQRIKPAVKGFSALIRKAKNGAFGLTKDLFKKITGKPISPARSKQYKGFLKREINGDTVLFIGYNYTYTDNSRYLFEQMIADEGNKKIYFATKNKAVDKKYRIEPMSKEFYSVLATAKLVIFDSWINPNFVKRPDTAWIQLWHGTPIKKMLFDSKESEIITHKKDHKIQKYKDIQNWDYLITDNENVNKFFETAFLFPKNKILSCGYPKVKYLCDNKNNLALKAEIKAKYNIPEDKKLAVYLPTWRDYNYGKTDNFDKTYLLDTRLLKEKLGDEYRVIEKEHFYLHTGPDANRNMDTQELLLVADCVITDYSSVMFDAFAIDLPVVIYAADFEKYRESRGVYPEIWKELAPYVSETVENVADKVLNYEFNASYQHIKDTYCFKDNTAKLKKLIDGILA